MRRVIAAFNMTLDGISDHTAGVADEELHAHYSDLLDRGGLILYGRITYELMQFWQTLLDHPSEERSMNTFARAIDRIPKLVFTHTRKDTGWNSAEIARRSLEEEIRARRKEPGNDILIGSRSLIMQCLDHNLIDEFQLCIHPVIEGRGQLLFDTIKNKIALKLVGTKVFGSGAVIIRYKPVSHSR